MILYDSVQTADTVQIFKASLTRMCELRVSPEKDLYISPRLIINEVVSGRHEEDGSVG